jgi:hypothetical protein
MTASPTPLTEPQLAALAKVACGIETGAVVALLCGPAGVGKTTVLEHLASDPRVTPDDLPIRDVAAWLSTPGDLPAVLPGLTGPDRVVVADCLTLWASNLLLADADMEAATSALGAAVADAMGPLILVSNEVGLGIVPSGSMSSVNNVLNAAAWTYVAATLQSVLTLLYYASYLTGGSSSDSDQ